MRNILFFLLWLSIPAIAQQKKITLEDIYKKGTFRAEVIPGFAVQTMDSMMLAAGIKDGNTKLDVKDYVMSRDKKKALIFIGREYIYRRSTKALCYVYDFDKHTLSKLDSAKLLHAAFSPDGSKVSYVKNNNIFIYDVPAGSTKAVTTDGNGIMSSMATATGCTKKNSVLHRLINGARRGTISRTTALMKAM
ncbi:MAG: DPP IV N-terminal domain-containing protein [Bacteroidota bacterium]